MEVKSEVEIQEKKNMLLGYMLLVICYWLCIDLYVIGYLKLKKNIPQPIKQDTSTKLAQINWLIKLFNICRVRWIQDPLSERARVRILAYPII